MNKLPEKKLARMGDHNGPINALAYSSGAGQYLLSGSSDRTINLYNPSKASPDGGKPSSALIQTYSGAHGYEVLSLAVAQDNSRFVSGGGDKTVFLWDVTTGHTIRRFGGSAGHSGRIEAVTFAGEQDSVVVSGSFDSSVRLWDTKSQSTRPLMVLGDAKDSVTSAAAMQHEIVTGSVDGRLRIYDIRMGMFYMDVIGDPVTSITLTIQSDAVLVSSLDSKVRLIDKAAGKLLQRYAAPTFINTTYRVRSTLGNRDSLALSGSEDGSIYAWDVLTAEPRGSLRHSETLQGLQSGKNVVSAIAFNDRTEELASAGSDGTIMIWGQRK